MGDFKQPVLDRGKLEDLLEIVTKLSSTISEHGSSNISDEACIDLKYALNKFMPDYECNQVYISDNDKEFFGIFIDRKIHPDIFFIKDMRDIEERCINNYSIDIDIKLFQAGMIPQEILSLMLYDLYKILSYEATTDAVAAVDAICAGRKETYRCTHDIHTGMIQLVQLCMSDYLYRKFSICAQPENELIRIPEVLIAYDMGSVFESATNKLFKLSNAGSRVMVNPALPLNWVFSIMLKYDRRSTDVINVLNDFLSISGSALICNKAFMISKYFATVVNDEIKKVVGEASLFTSIRKSGMKSLENDLFEYEMRVKNIYDEDSAIFLMRQINSRMSIIQDYLEEEKLSDSELRRWQSLYDRYDLLRTKMTSKNIYSKKMYGLFTDYNALMQPGSENTMTMRTMY